MMRPGTNAEPELQNPFCKTNSFPEVLPLQYSMLTLFSTCVYHFSWLYRLTRNHTKKIKYYT